MWKFSSSANDLEYIHKNKTAALLTLCVRMGCILANCNERDLINLTNYAEKIGRIYQNRDHKQISIYKKLLCDK